MPLTAEDIAAYLDTQDDFDLELFVHRSLAMSGFRSEHAGTYSDPVTGRPRRFDVRARRFFPHARRQVLLAVECQSLSPECPVVVSRVPRSTREGYHEVVRSWQVQETGEVRVEVLRWERGLELYPENVQVGRRIARVRRGCDANGAATSAADDRDVEWSHAIASAEDLVREADRACTACATPDCHTLVLPVLVVSDEALWAVDYTETGQRARSALPVQEAEVYVGREYGLRPGYTYRISHLHLFSRRGFARFVAQLAEPASGLLEQMFQFTSAHREKPRSGERASSRSRRGARGAEDTGGRADIAPLGSKLSPP